MKDSIWKYAREIVKTFNIYLSPPPIVMVYPQSKVASSSVYHSLNEQYQGQTWHFHNYERLEKFHDRNILNILKEETIRKTLLHLKNASLLRRYRYFVERPDDRIKLISLVRDPLGRNVSAFFQDKNSFWKGLWSHTRQELKKGTLDMDALIPKLKTLFLEKYSPEKGSYWFDNQLKRYFGIDVYSQPFPTVGHIRFKTEKGLELLLMRYDLDDSLKEKLIGDYVGIEDFRLQHRNIGVKKEYGPVYAEFKRRVKFPAWYIEKVRASKYFTHFYSREEIERVCAKWSESSVPETADWSSDTVSREESSATN